MRCHEVPILPTTIWFLRIHSGSSKIGQQMMLVQIICKSFPLNIDGQDTQCCVFRPGCICVNMYQLIQLEFSKRCDIADGLWAPWMMKEALLQESKSPKWDLTFSRRVSEEFWIDLISASVVFGASGDQYHTQRTQSVKKDLTYRTL